MCAFSLHLPLKLLHDLPPSSPHPFPSPSPSSPSSPSQSPLMKAGGQESTSLRQIFQVSRWGKLFKDKIYMYSDIARVTLNYSCKSFVTLTVSTTAINHPWLPSILPGLPRYLNPTLVTLNAIIGICPATLLQQFFTASSVGMWAVNLGNETRVFFIYWISNGCCSFFTMLIEAYWML